MYPSRLRRKIYTVVLQSYITRFYRLSIIYINVSNVKNITFNECTAEAIARPCDNNKEKI